MSLFRGIDWATLKSAFAVLAGKSGGQTLIGGTGVTDKLVLQGTSGNGTSTATALEVKVGNNGALSALNLLNSGQLIIQGDATTDLPVYGSELLTSAGWTVTAGWTESPDDTFAHSSGTTTLSHSATITNGYKYQISWTITGRTTGNIAISVGGQSLAAQTETGTFGPTATATTAFTITPSTDFNGTVSLVSLKQITAGSTPYLVLKSSAGVSNLEIRHGNTTDNCYIGLNAGKHSTTGSNNTAIGTNTLQNVTTGSANNAIGASALSNLFAGTNNNAMGSYALYSLTTGGSNSGIGRNALYSLTTGSNNNGLGAYALHNATTGRYNIAFGHNAGRYHADGSTPLADSEYSVYIGSGARGKDNSDDNSVVIGGNTPIGLGANTTVIGTSNTTLTRLYGNVATGTDSPSAAFHAIKTTEQLRLGYDASYYASFTVSSAGNLTLTNTGTTIYTDKVIENTVSGAGIVLKSPDGTRYRLTVANGGTLSIAAA